MKRTEIRERRIEVALVVFVLFVSSGVATVFAQPGDYRAYVPNAADGTVSAVDFESGTIVWVTQVSEGSQAQPPEAAHGIAVSPDGMTVYAGDAATGELVVLHAAGGHVVARLALPHNVHGIDISPDGRTVWVGGSDPERFWLGMLSVVSTDSMSVIRTVAPAVGSAAHVAFSPDGAEVWVASTTTNLVWVVDGRRMRLRDVIAMADAEFSGAATPEGELGLVGINEVAVSPDGARAYAVGPEAAILYAIEVPYRRVSASVAAEPRAHGIVVSPDGTEVWTANRSGSLTVFDAATLDRLASVPMGDFANHVAFVPGGGLVLGTGESSLVVVDAATRRTIRSIPVGREPHEIAIGPIPPSEGD